MSPSARNRQRVDGLVVSAHDGGWSTERSRVKAAECFRAVLSAGMRRARSRLVELKEKCRAKGRRETDVFKSPLRDSEMMLLPDQATPTCMSST
jgi:hypothetical protein